MLQPKRTKFRKAHKGRIHGVAKGGTDLNFGQFGLKATEPERVTARQIEAARRAITREMKRQGRVWIRIFPDLPVSKKPTEVRMGKGKGSVEFWAARVKPGRVMFEIDGVPEDIAREALRLGAMKLPITTRDVARINDAARGKFLSIVGVSLALLRNYDPTKAPTHFKIVDLLQKFDKCFGATGRNYGKVTGDRTMADIEKRRADRWNFLFIAGMWFQDLFNYDFRRTEQCIIPYATQEGEISFCAYNTGVGWRNIIEKMHMTSTLTKWYEEHGRHEIFAGGKKVGMTQVGHELKLNMEHVNSEANHTLDNLGIAKNAREEKLRARAVTTADKVKADAENAKMAKLYREHVLGEKPVEGIVSIDSIAPAKPVQPAEPVAGD